VILSETHYHWNSNAKDWYAHPNYAYDINGNLLLICQYEGAQYGGEYCKLYHKYEWTYDNKGNRITQIKNGLTRYEWTYDNNGNITTHAILNSNDEVSSKSEYTYDFSYSIADLIYPPPYLTLSEIGMDFLNSWYGHWDWEPHTSNMLTEIVESWDETGWRLDTTILYWSGKQFGIADFPKDNSSIKVYPNPTTGELTIDASTSSATYGELTINNVEVFDIYGKLLSSHHLIPSSSNHLLNISHLTAGVYFIKISTEEGEIVRKIVKE
jgi:hypothetical protein